ncbi:peptide-methionine (S)-S-oxide reductase [Polaribacter batillariae]|uniref:peptide-methionine (S)-S-oxide reductase n=1 Tax=Polaribacter batillariae TaxID=2808900 RepID=A0ABX7SSV5_9FLAO|nr:peptide-methionine (S)-S-oxide reductase [Polaribacter batillariae]QTD36739.1 peptide-methionine (S)-S-oxide reductase [Polaribacter batillariae]
MLQKIAFGGGCHWCTEAVFQSLIGVEKVEQGWVSSIHNHTSFSEAVVVSFWASKITLETLIEIHLLTHKSTSQHSMREKYRSAIYYFSKFQKDESLRIIEKLQPNFKEKIITKTLKFSAFKSSIDEFKNYYYTNPKKPFCENYISPKLQLIMAKFSNVVSKSKVSHLDATILQNKR